VTLLVLALLLLVLVAAGGTLVARTFGIGRRWWLDASLGLAGLGTVFTFLLLAGAFRTVPLLVLATLALAGGIAAGGTRPLLPRFRARREGAAVAVLATLAGLAMIVLTLYPYQASDFRTYQYPMALGYAETGAWTWFEDLRFPTFPPLMNLWFAAAALFGGEWGVVLAQLTALLPFFLLCALLAHWSLQLGEGPPIYAPALLAGSPTVVWAATYAFVDTAMTLFGVLSVYCLHRFHQEGGWRARGALLRWPALGGLLAGAAMNVEYLGLFFLAFGAIWARRRRR